eukprot:Gb_40913 [translate_table: standard]
MLFFGNSKDVISGLKSHLSAQFNMKDLGAAKYILEMEIKRDRVNRKLWLGQKMENMACVPYASVVGSLMYVMVCTRPDITHVVGVLSRFMVNPKHEHWVVVKRIFRYLRGTFKFSIYYHGDIPGDQRSVDIHGYVDFDWAGDVDSKRSTSGYVF